MQTLLILIHQTGFQLFAKVISAISTILILKIINQNYGEYGLGIYTLIVSYLGFFYLACDLGLNGYFLKKFTRFNLDRLLGFRLGFSIVLCLIANILIIFMPFNNPDFQKAVTIGSASIVFYSLVISFNLTFQKNLRYNFVSVASVIGSLLIFVLILLISHFSDQIWTLLPALVIGWSVNFGISLYLVHKLNHKYRPRFDFGWIKRTFQIVWPISATLLVNTFYFRIDSFILATYTGFVEVGAYNLAYQFFQTILVLPTFIMNAFYPILISSLTNNHRFRQKAIKGLILMTGLGILGTVGGYFSAGLMVGIVATIESSYGSITYLQVLVLGLPGYFISSFLMWLLMSLSKYKILFVIYLTGFILNLVLNLIYIPQYGALAAAWTTILSEYFILIVLIATALPFILNKTKKL